MVAQQAVLDPGPGRDVAHGRPLETAFGKQGQGRAQDRGAGILHRAGRTAWTAALAQGTFAHGMNIAHLD
jgi:hypothetical protein